ncbi:MAG: anhydro-N-acetylmuramic acid kinase [Rhodobacteraceae bacterium]|nr:anhydro-N-acetylmuramic acid kinase [Alphaproteobacteria bacterium]NNF71500.1 anhydro-N-acetylmuramic acid kinase [Paracoccaceae bacterium]NNK68757.1 anhydro-N-acetylmuramic acid kinase [Paracoccaceae bacterium]
MTNKGAIWALGAMSGTSLDGVDAALLRTDGQAIFEMGKSAYRAYSEDEREVLRAALGQMADGADVPAAAEVVETAHAEVLARFDMAEIIGFHGQTLAHRPQDGLTHQAGDGDVLAAVLDKTVVWDFRSNDMEMGGQGAPLAPFYHHACARFIGAKRPLAFLNIGGVSNLTWVDPGIDRPEAAGALLAFDTGPGNAPLNDLMQARRGQTYDRDGALAAQGSVAAPVIDKLMAAGFFLKMPPKSLDRNDFSDLDEHLAGLSDADAAATLTAAVAASVTRGLEHCPTPPERLLVTGGGRKNPVMMAMIEAGFGGQVDPVEAVGLDGDMLEAQAFAYLAVRVARGLPTSAPATTGVAAPVGGGRISRPGSG